MKLKQWALTAEIVSGFAVVVTLIFLIIQVNGNTEATLATTRQSVASRVETILLAPATSPDFSDWLDQALEERLGQWSLEGLHLVD